MASMIVVQYADISATGFSRQEDRDRPARRAFWQAAEDLLFSDVVQPPESIRSTVAAPVWSLRRITVEGRPYWCFAVQGRGGPFGVAGTCRFGFLEDVDLHPAQAWEEGCRALTVNDPPPPDPDRAVLAGAYATVLAAVLLNRPVVDIPAGPAEAAILIPNVLRALPARQAGRYAWSTCLLQRPEGGGQRIAAGRLPEAMARHAASLTRNLEHLFSAVDRDPLDVLHFDNDLQKFGFEWLVRCAAGGHELDEDLRTAELRSPQLLERIAAVHKKLLVGDVPRLLADPVQRPLLLRALDVLGRWAKSNSSPALRHVRDERASEVREVLFGFLVDLQSEHPTGNVLGLPTARRFERAWVGDLAALLKQHFQADVFRIASFAMGLTEEGSVYGDPADRAAARGLWTRLGITLDMPEADILLTASADFALDALARSRSRTLPDVTREEIAFLRRPLTEVGAVLHRYREAGLRVTPEAAAELVAALLAPREDQPGTGRSEPNADQWLHHVARQLVPDARTTAWVCDFLVEINRHRAVDADSRYDLAHGLLTGYAELLGTDVPLPEGELRDLLLKAGLREGAQPPLWLLRQPQPAPRTRTRSQDEGVEGLYIPGERPDHAGAADGEARTTYIAYPPMPHDQRQLVRDEHSPIPVPQHGGRKAGQAEQHPQAGTPTGSRGWWPLSQRMLLISGVISVCTLILAILVVASLGGPDKQNPLNGGGHPEPTHSETSPSRPPATRVPTSPPDVFQGERVLLFPYRARGMGVPDLVKELKQKSAGQKIVEITLYGNSSAGVEEGRRVAEALLAEISKVGAFEGTEVIVGDTTPGQKLPNGSVTVAYRLAPVVDRDGIPRAE